MITPQECCSSPFYFALFLPSILTYPAAFSLRLSARSFQPRVDHAWQVQQTEPSGVAESHAVKIKKKDRNRAISAIYSDVAAAKSHKWKKERKKKRPGATSRCLGPLWLHTAFSCKPLAAERRMLKAMCGHFIWDTLSVLRGWGTNAVLLPFISLSFSLLSWPSTRLSARGFQPRGAFGARLSAV